MWTELSNMSRKKREESKGRGRERENMGAETRRDLVDQEIMWPK